MKRIRTHQSQKSNILAVDDQVINYGLQLLDGDANVDGCNAGDNSDSDDNFDINPNGVKRFPSMLPSNDNADTNPKTVPNY